MTRLARGLLCSLCLACAQEPKPAPKPAPEVQAAPEPASATTLFSEAEEKLLAAKSLTIEAAIESTGLFEAKLEGFVDIVAPDKLRIAFDGTFGGEPVRVRYVADGVRTSLGEDAPPEVVAAVLIGMTRMGLLHNLAVLIDGKGPDHAGGGVREWVVPKELRPPPRPGARPIEFALEVAGQPAGDVQLWLGDESLLPTGRVQTVRFEEGSMTVHERYLIHVDAPIASDRFAL